MQLFDKSVFGLSDILPVSKNQLYCPIYQTTFLLVKCVFVAIDKQFDGKFPKNGKDSLFKKPVPRLVCGLAIRKNPNSSWLIV